MEIVRHADFDEAAYRRLCSGYASSEIYSVARTGGEDAPAFSLALERLPAPARVTWEPSPSEMEDLRATSTRPGSHLFWALEGDEKVGVAFAEERAWNRTLWIWGFYVEERSRRRGVGRALMERLLEVARGSSLRAVVAETQTRNVSAIRFYRAMGFELEGVDISYYTNEDLEKGEVAVFMKRRL